MLRFFRATRLGWLTLLLVNCSLLVAKAQAPKTYTSSEILLGLKKLNTLGSVLYIAAHPDDENTRLLAYLANERHVETAYLSLTRGDGGQNLIGPELRDQLGVIRTQELLAARRIDGAQQFFTRANDFGFSKTAQEALTVWDHEQVLSDVVWVIRQRRPDVLITRFPPDPRAGHGHHQASAVLAAEAFDAAGDPKRFPEQLKYVQPWQPKRLLWNTGSFFVRPGENMDGYLKLDAGDYNPLLGQSYGEIAARSRSQHRSQGMGSAATRGETTEYFQLVKGAPATKDIFDGVDLTWNRVTGGAALGKLVDEVIRKYDASDPSASTAALLKVREELLELHKRGKILGGSKGYIRLPDYFWVKTKQERVDELISACLGLHLEAIVAASTAAPGQMVAVRLELLSRSPLPVVLKQASGIGFGHDTTLAQALNVENPVTLRLPIRLGSSLTTSQPYWLREPAAIGMYRVPDELLLAQGGPITNGSEVPGISTELPFYAPDPIKDEQARKRLSQRNALLLVTRQNLLGLPESPAYGYISLQLQVAGTPLLFSIPVQYKHTDPVLGELYQPLAVVPPVMVNIPAARAYVFADQQPKPVPVTLRAGQAGVSGTLALQLPSGWQAEPASVPFSLKNKDDEQTITFNLRPLAGAAEGKVELRAVATVGGQPYSRGIQTIAYPHIPTQTLFPEATSPLVRLNVARGHTRTVGYLMGAGDEVPEALRQLGYTVTLLDPNTDLTLERLRRFDAVVLGVRAYNTVEQLKTRQPELLRYVEQGGTMLVQYVVTRGTILPQIGPYPLTLSNNRITVENSPVTLLKPSVPVLSEPNKLTAADFDQGWVQEQGLYYPAQWDAHYQPVIASHDPGEADQQSAILVAPYGKGRYIYTGLSLFRELPVGVPGAYRILANLVESGGK